MLQLQGLQGLEYASQGTIQEINPRLKTAAQWWEQLLHATGRQLELPKCFYYLLHWLFDSKGYARLATPEELGIKISLRQKRQRSKYLCHTAFLHDISSHT
jgi:hypothetical protein